MKQVLYFAHGINSVNVLITISQFFPSPPCPLSVHTVVLYVCVSSPALQIRSSIPFFWILHTCVNIWDLFF